MLLAYFSNFQGDSHTIEHVSKFNVPTNPQCFLTMEAKCRFLYELCNKSQRYICIVTEATVVVRNTRIKGLVGEHLPGKFK